ncbi:MAG: DEAD/DEAH box helicase, partial [Chloroflexi bacterium]|nr:DEAD/DEAH box helicase [Chloroflexota bacterium]
MKNSLDAFSPFTRAWFEKNFRDPTPPQEQGWLPIQRGEHTLILAPTGSGKTLAAFLWGIDQLYREITNDTFQITKSVRLLYISPLKALNNDIERNLRAPLAGIRDQAARAGISLPELRVAVRTGDTPARERAAMLKKPPHILITTPESLYLMLTSPRARELFRAVRTIIVDEIHTLVGNKRGAHLALSLERVEEIANARVQRIGLSATIKPLEEAARWLGGQEQSPVTSQQSTDQSPRSVTIVNAAYKKNLDLRVVTVADDLSKLQTTSIWPLVVPDLLNEIRRHTTTLIFANNRRLAERTADRLNAQLDAEQKEEIAPGSPRALAPQGIARDRGMFAIGAPGPFRAHHGSMSKDARRKMEEDLKSGKLPALVGTSSLELGIDIGAIDLVLQLQSPKSVAQGLQRVGRSGHLVGQTSVGRIYATFREDLVEAAAIARGMLDGDVESTIAPQNPLDVLAQQIVAMVACEEWDARALFDVVRRAYVYRDLSWSAFEAVLEMLAGKYHVAGVRGTDALRAKISFDRVNNRLRALPGSRLLAIQNAGTIPDTGAYTVYLGDNKTKIGEVDEEFVFETRAGDNFLLGSRVWRVLEIKDDRLIVGDAAGATPRMPFWNGDYPYRPYELGLRIGKFRREIVERVGRDESPTRLYHELQREYALDENSARNLIAHAQKQLDAVGVMSSDQTIVAETFNDAVGEPRLVIHSPFGGRVNGAWALALKSAMEERYRIEIEMQTNDDGILFRFPQSHTAPPLDLVRDLSAREARARILRELPHSALFGARFRMNAARALLL